MRHEFFDLLQALVDRGYRFQHLRDRDGELMVIVGSYGWGPHCDRLHVWAEHEAVAARELADRRPWRAGVVWSHHGSAADTARPAGAARSGPLRHTIPRPRHPDGAVVASGGGGEERSARR